MRAKRRNRADITFKEKVDIPGVGLVDVLLLSYLEQGPSRTLASVKHKYAGLQGASKGTIDRRYYAERWKERAAAYDKLIEAGTAPEAAASQVLSGWRLHRGPLKKAVKLTNEGRKDAASVTQPTIAPDGSESPSTEETADPPLFSSATPEKVKKGLEDAFRKVVEAGASKRDFRKFFREKWNEAIGQAARDAAEDAQQVVQIVVGNARMLLDACFLGMQQAHAFLSANKVRLIQSGNKLIDGSEEMIVLVESDITIDDRMVATAWLAKLQTIHERIAHSNVINTLEKDVLAMEALQAELQTLRMRIEGTLPPERVKVEFDRMEEERLERLRQRMPPDAFAHFLNALEDDARSLHAASGGEDEGPRGSGGPPN